MQENKGNVGWAVLGGFFPLVGLILWLVWKETKPADAKMAGKGALIGVTVSVSLFVLMFLMESCMMMISMNSMGNAMNGIFDAFNNFSSDLSIL